MTKKSRIFYFFISLVLFIVMDIYLSNYAVKYGFNIVQNEFVDIVYVQNKGAAFSIFEGAKWFLILFALLTSLFITQYTIRNITRWSVLTIFLISMLNAGIITNMIERLCLGYVRDYIKLNFVDFPVFNISDIFINISVFSIVIIILINKYAKNNENYNR